MAYRKFIRKVRKGARRVDRGIRKVQRNPVVKNLARGYQLYQDVQMLKHLVNIEKKRFDMTAATALTVGQLNGGAGTTTGYSSTVITPYPIEGVAQGQRIGLSVKLVSCCFDLQLFQQANTANPLKIRWAIVCRPDNSSNPSSVQSITDFYEVNPFSNVIDAYSARDPEYFTAFKVIKSGSIIMKQDQFTGGTSIIQKRVPLKLNHHLKFNTDGSTVTTKNQFYLFMTSSSGDKTTNTGITGNQTGAQFQYNFRWYYTDN